jgi:two-component system heavy metal sensor histidine kinase CusS
MRRPSLTLRLAILIACLAFGAMATLGATLYVLLVAQLSVRDDAALLTRVDQIRTLLQNDDARELIRDKPALFGNMLGNTESLLIVRYVGQRGTPLIVVNPGHRPVPDTPPVKASEALTLKAVQHGHGPDGIPFIYVAAEGHALGNQPPLEIISGRLLTERTRLLRAYQEGILAFSLVAAGLVALLAFVLARRSMAPVRRLAEQTAGIGVATLSFRLDEQEVPRELEAMVLQFNAMLDRLERGFTQLKQVSADMAHDLRTPINNMLGQIEVGLGQVRDVTYYQRLAGSSYEELQRLSKMIDNMLFLARAEYAVDAIDRNAVDIADELRRMCDYFEDLADDHDVRLRWTGTGSIWADAALLRRALANLLSNAVRFAAPSSDITITAEQGQKETQIHVTNLGATIPTSALDKVFDRFYRADDSRQQSTDSNGLGLSIVESIMRLHGGRCAVTSSEGVTRFSLIFPNTTG